MQKDFRRLVGKNAKRLAEKQTGRREASRLQVEHEEKRGTTTKGSSLANVGKTHEEERADLMVLLFNGGALQDARASPLEEA